MKTYVYFDFDRKLMYVFIILGLVIVANYLNV